jgi:preprotein translocase subunit SecA
MRLFKSDWVDRVLTVLKVPDDVPIENKRVTGAIANAQGQIESQNFESRKNVLKYDDVMDRQRHVIYAERRAVSVPTCEQVRGMIDDVISAVSVRPRAPRRWDLEALRAALRRCTRCPSSSTRSRRRRAAPRGCRVSSLPRT